MAENKASVRDVKDALQVQMGKLEEVHKEKLATRTVVEGCEQQLAGIAEEIGALVTRYAGVKGEVEKAIEAYGGTTKKLEETTSEVIEISDGSSPLQESAVGQLRAANEGSGEQLQGLGGLNEGLDKQGQVLAAMQNGVGEYISLTHEVSDGMGSSATQVGMALGDLQTWMSV